MLPTGHTVLPVGVPLLLEKLLMLLTIEISIKTAKATGRKVGGRKR